MGTRIDRGHPLAQGLVACYLLNEGGGRTAYDLASEGISIPFVGSASWINGRVQTAGTGQAVYGIANPSLHLNPPLTVVWQGQSIAAASNVPLFGILYSNPDGAPFWCCATGLNTSGGINFSWNSTGTLHSLTSAATPALTVGKTNQIAGVMRDSGGSMSVFIFNNGTSFIGPSSSITNIINYTATSTIGFGDITNFTPSNIISDFGLVYNIGLSNGHLDWLAAEPYAMYLPPSLNAVTFLMTHAGTTPSNFGALLPAM